MHLFGWWRKLEWTHGENMQKASLLEAFNTEDGGKFTLCQENELVKKKKKKLHVVTCKGYLGSCWDLVFLPSSNLLESVVWRKRRSNNSCKALFWVMGNAASYRERGERTTLYILHPRLLSFYLIKNIFFCTMTYVFSYGKKNKKE